jgi:hypothetical protein
MAVAITIFVTAVLFALALERESRPPSVDQAEHWRRQQAEREIDVTLRLAESRMEALAEHQKRDLDLSAWEFRF